eukprot:3818380-Prorocentrum_lima.AAC.1
MPAEPRQPKDTRTRDDDEDDWGHPRQYRCIEEEIPEQYTAVFFCMVAAVQMSSVLWDIEHPMYVWEEAYECYV